EQQIAGENDYHPGDRIECRYQSRRREFVVAGLVTTPEYLMLTPDRFTMFVDPETFGVVFLDSERAGEWLGTGRSISEIHTLVDPGHKEEVREKLHGLCSSYGVDTSFTQEEQPSVKLLRMDQEGLRSMSVFFPILFLGASGLFLYVALSRIVRLQVRVIGTLRALGLSSRQVLLQYLVQALLMTQAGAIPGAIVGHFLTLGMGEMYVQYLKLPFVLSDVRWDTILAGLAMAAGTGMASAWIPARMAARLSPAVAMRGDVEGEGSLRGAFLRWTQRVRVMYRIPLRGLLRKPSRTLLAMAGIAGGAMIIILTLGQFVAFGTAMEEYLGESRSYQLDVAFVMPGREEVATGAAGMDGVHAVSKSLSLPVSVRSNWGEAELMLTGLERGQRLQRIKAKGGGWVEVSPGEIWLPEKIAQRLRVDVGDPLHVEWAKASRARPVDAYFTLGGISQAAMGGAAYGEYDDIDRSLGEHAYPYTGYAVQIDCDPDVAPRLKRMLERSEYVGGVVTSAEIEEQIGEQTAALYGYILLLLAFGEVLAGSAIHTVATVSLIERTRELATLRSLGLSAGATAGLASIELYVMAVLGLIAGIPAGAVTNTAFIESFSTEQMSFPSTLPPWVFAATAILVLLTVSYSSWRGRKTLASMDLSQATKARE
ncbi:MAG: FtsX-like permease family protein, partial [Armatimonadia bacterium]|nr:FtsX-like permease family protein [Armatimonadia bacterium]